MEAVKGFIPLKLGTLGGLQGGEAGGGEGLGFRPRLIVEARLLFPGPKAILVDMGKRYVSGGVTQEEGEGLPGDGHPVPEFLLYPLEAHRRHIAPSSEVIVIDGYV